MYPKTERLIDKHLQALIYPGVEYAFISARQVIRTTKGDAQIIPKRETLQPDMLFDAASLTKVIGTTTVVLKWAKEENISLHEPLYRFLPNFKDKLVTIHHLLTHSADIDSFIPQRDQLDASELRSAFMNLSSGDMRGKRVVYTDTGTILLGFMLEEIYAKPVQEVITRSVLLPLGMTRATFSPSNSADCAAEEVHPIRGVIRGQVHDPKAYTLGTHAGSAGLFINMTDLVKFTQMMLRGGFSESGEEIIPSIFFKELLVDQTPESGVLRSLGWNLLFDQQDQHPILFHTGYTGTFMLIDILKEEAFLFLSNRVHPYDQREIYLKERDYLIKTYLTEKMKGKVL